MAFILPSMYKESPIFAFACISLNRAMLVQGRHDSTQGLLLELLGLRWEGLLAAATLPVLLTAALFLGPLCMLTWDRCHASSINTEQRSLLQVCFIDAVHILDSAW